MSTPTTIQSGDPLPAILARDREKRATRDPADRVLMTIRSVDNFFAIFSQEQAARKTHDLPGAGASAFHEMLLASYVDAAACLRGLAADLLPSNPPRLASAPRSRASSRLGSSTRRSPSGTTSGDPSRWRLARGPTA